MATVTLVQGGGLPSTDFIGSGQLTPYVYVVEGHAVGQDPRTVVGTNGVTPIRLNAAIDIGGKTFHCDRVECSHSYSDTATEVTCYLSTDRRFGYPNRQGNPDESGYYNWGRSFQLTKETVPEWERADAAASQGDGVVTIGQEWQATDYELDKSLAVFWVSLRIENIDPSGLRVILNQTMNVEGEIHILPMFDAPPQWNAGPLRALYPESTGNVFDIPTQGRVWVLQEPELSGPGLTPDTGQTYTIITYTWLSDKGTWNAPPVDMVPAFAERYSIAPPRPPWHKYVKRRSTLDPTNGEPNSPAHLGHPLGAPIINVVPHLPMNDDNPFWKPTGYLNLPGAPIV